MGLKNIDPILEGDPALRRLGLYRQDSERFYRDCLKIRNKNGDLVPFELNPIQKIINQQANEQAKETGMVRAIVLKYRRAGASTFILGRGYHKATLHHGVSVAIMAHLSSSTNALYRIVKRFHDNNPIAPNLGTANMKGLEFSGMDSRYSIYSSETEDAGRGDEIGFLHLCLDENTPIVMGDGSLRPMKEIALGDTVVTHNSNTAPVSVISRQEKDCIELRVRGHNRPLVCTPEHKIWTEDGMKEAGEVTVGDFVGTPIREITDTHEGFTARRMGRGGVCNYRHRNHHFPEFTVRPSYGLGRVIGLYLAEGHAKKSHRPLKDGSHPLHQVDFACHQRELDRNVGWLQEQTVMDAFSLDPDGKKLPTYSAGGVVNKNGDRAVAIIYGRTFAEFINSICGRTRGKHLPDRWWECGEDFVRGMVHGYLAGDGHSPPKVGARGIMATSIDSAIAIGMRDAIMALGYGVPALDFKKAGYRYGRNNSDAQTIRLHGHGVDRLADELEMDAPERKRIGYRPDWKIEDGYAWSEVIAVNPVGKRNVMDFEVDHPDHSYRTNICAVSNSEGGAIDNLEEQMSGIGNCVSEVPGTEIWIEGTAKQGFGPFYERCMDCLNGASDYKLIFVPWNLDPDCYMEPPADFEPSLERDNEAFMSEHELLELQGLTLGQIYWRRRKMGGGRNIVRWSREFPLTVQDCFTSADDDTFISPVDVQRARKANIKPVGAVIIGVDPASMGGDRFTIAVRQGRKVLKVDHRTKVRFNEGLEWIKAVIEDWKPTRVYIDAGGGGNGDALCSNLRDDPKYKDIIRAVNFGSTSQWKLARPDKPGPKNRKAEMAGRLREALESEEGLDIPDDHELAADILALKVQWINQEGDWQLVPKNKLKVRSHDMADAVGLTWGDKHVEPLQFMDVDGKQIVIGPDRSAPNLPPPGAGWMS